MKQETAYKAAKWWADFLRNPGPMNNGDDSPTGDMMRVMMTLLQDEIVNQFSKEQIDIFEKHLADSIITNDSDWLNVDYHPCLTLSDAATKAGIDVDFILPVKTSMWIEGDKITVSIGYRGEQREI